MENPLRYVKLLPLQGARFATQKITQGAALGYELLPFLGVLLIWALNYPIYPPVRLILPSTPSCMVDIILHALLYG